MFEDHRSELLLFFRMAMAATFLVLGTLEFVRGAALRAVIQLVIEWVEKYFDQGV